MSTTNPLISIIMPTYNRSYHIKRSIESILNQSYRNIELIIIDDGSTDNTPVLIKSINDSRIKYIRNSNNSGAQYSRNVGLSNASGRFISLIDDDDYWFHRKIELQYSEFLRQNSIDNTNPIGLVNCGYIKYIKKFKKYKKIAFPKKILTNNDILKKNLLKDPLIKKECFDKVGGFDLKMQSCQDWDMWIRISFNYDIINIETPLIMYNVHGNQISKDTKKIVKGQERILFKHWNHFKENKDAYVYIHNSLSFFYLNSNQPKKSLIFLIESIRSFEFQVETIFLLLYFIIRKVPFIKKLNLFFSKFDYIIKRDILSNI